MKINSSSCVCFDLSVILLCRTASDDYFHYWWIYWFIYNHSISHVRVSHYGAKSLKKVSPFSCMLDLFQNNIFLIICFLTSWQMNKLFQRISYGHYCVLPWDEFSFFLWSSWLGTGLICLQQTNWTGIKCFTHTHKWWDTSLPFFLPLKINMNEVLFSMPWCHMCRRSVKLF